MSGLPGGITTAEQMRRLDALRCALNPPTRPGWKSGDECVGPDGARCGIRHRSYMASVKHSLKLSQEPVSRRQH